FLGEFVEHEGAGHAADVSERKIAEQRGRENDVAKGVAKHIPLALQCRVQKVEAGDGREGVCKDDIEAAGKGDPLQLGIKQDKRQETKPEDRQRIAYEADDPEDLIDEAAAANRGQPT